MVNTEEVLPLFIANEYSFHVSIQLRHCVVPGVPLLFLIDRENKAIPLSSY